MSLLSRRSPQAHSRLVRLPSKLGESTQRGSGSCPNSPAVKKVFRLVVVGSARTGKSAIVNRFLNNEFEERYIPTIENFHRKLYKIRGELFQLDIVDCSGNDPFPATRKLSYTSG
uniref:Ras-like protein family member 10B n=1 Tax=Ascaris lumbricoides TaxID=6252 RepID=A0A0M3HEY7_ASCLU